MKENTMHPNREGYVLEFEDNFTSDTLNDIHWFPYYLPHWSTKSQSQANYKWSDGNLILQITKDQKPWCPSLDGEVKCSSIQTGIFSGPLGSTVGQHHFNQKCVVTEEQVSQKLYTPQYGYFELRAKANNIADSNMIAFWMIGFEDEPEKSGEICIMEIFGNQIEEKSVVTGSGIHPFGDKRLKDEFYKDTLELDISEFHVFGVEWTAACVKFFVDDVLLRTIEQSPKYPMQFMIDIFEFPEQNKDPEEKYPKEFCIDYVRGYRLNSEI